MKKIFIVLAIVAVGVSGYLVLDTKRKAPNPSAPVYNGEPTFTWQYTPFMDREFPKTQVSLTARYANGTTETKYIGTVDGSCNDHSSPDEDVYSRSTMILCYAAGLGHYFKVVQSGTMYQVLQKTFEEGTPDYAPPAEPFKPVAEF